MPSIARHLFYLVLLGIVVMAPTAQASKILLRFDGFMERTSTPSFFYLPDGRVVNLLQIRSLMYGRPFGPGDTVLFNLDSNIVTIFEKSLPANALQSSEFATADLQRDVARWAPDTRTIEVDNGPSNLNQPGAVVFVGRFNYDSYRIVDEMAGVIDDDEDNIDDNVDNCLGLSNPEQTDTDSDGAGDVCDADDDNDGIDDEFDIDSLDPSVCQDLDGDTCDDCANGDGFGPDPDFNADDDGLDTDGNGICDATDPDIDGDGLLNENDNCPNIFNEDQTDDDMDGTGDICQPSTKDDDLCIPLKLPTGGVSLICL